MKKLVVPFLLLVSLCACQKEENVVGNWSVDESTPNFPFKNGVAFNGDKTFEGRMDTNSITGEWVYDVHPNGDYLKVGRPGEDTIIFKIELLRAKKMKVSVTGYSFNADYATLKK